MHVEVALGGFSPAGEPSVRPHVEDQPMNPDDTVQASEEVGDEGEEANPARVLPSSTQPTRKEILENVLTHSASQIVVLTLSEGRGTGLPHFFAARRRGKCCVDCVNSLLLHGVHLDKRTQKVCSQCWR